MQRSNVSTCRKIKCTQFCGRDGRKEGTPRCCCTD